MGAAGVCAPLRLPARGACVQVTGYHGVPAAATAAVALPLPPRRRRRRQRRRRRRHQPQRRAHLHHCACRRARRRLSAVSPHRYVGWERGGGRAEGGSAGCCQSAGKGNKRGTTPVRQRTRVPRCALAAHDTPSWPRASVVVCVVGGGAVCSGGFVGWQLLLVLQAQGGGSGAGQAVSLHTRAPAPALRSRQRQWVAVNAAQLHCSSCSCWCCWGTSVAHPRCLPPLSTAYLSWRQLRGPQHTRRRTRPQPQRTARTHSTTAWRRGGWGAAGRAQSCCHVVCSQDRIHLLATGGRPVHARTNGCHLPPPLLRGRWPTTHRHTHTQQGGEGGIGRVGVLSLGHLPCAMRSSSREGCLSEWPDRSDHLR